MSRSPQYHEQSKSHRVISSHNGLWLPQYHIGRDDHLRSVDSGWRNLGRPTDHDTAIGRMNAAAGVR